VVALPFGTFMDWVVMLPLLSLLKNLKPTVSLLITSIMACMLTVYLTSPKSIAEAPEQSVSEGGGSMESIDTAAPQLPGLETTYVME
jgi:hypothetical protein